MLTDTKVHNFSNGAGTYTYVGSAPTLAEAASYCEHNPGHVALRRGDVYAVFRFGARKSDGNPHPLVDPVKAGG